MHLALVYCRKLIFRLLSTHFLSPLGSVQRHLCVDVRERERVRAAHRADVSNDCISSLLVFLIEEDVWKHKTDTLLTQSVFVMQAFLCFTISIISYLCYDRDYNARLLKKPLIFSQHYALSQSLMCKSVFWSLLSFQLISNSN